MVYQILGNMIPKGTIVHWHPRNNSAYRSENAHPRIIYVYDPIDGLLASQCTREYWIKMPWLHPHCTLFRMLYERLEISKFEYTSSR